MKRRDGGRQIGGRPSEDHRVRAAILLWLPPKTEWLRDTYECGWHGLTDIHQVGRSPGKDVQNGDRGEEDAPPGVS
jgi:hypothetical protein